MILGDNQAFEVTALGNSWLTKCAGLAGSTAPKYRCWWPQVRETEGALRRLTVLGKQACGGNACAETHPNAVLKRMCTS